MKTYKATPGDTINRAAIEMAEMALAANISVECNFNDITVRTPPGESPDEIVKRWYRRAKTKRRSAEYGRQQKNYERKQRERGAALNAALASAPPHMTLRDPEGWGKAYKANSGDYGRAVLAYAERWARLMETRISTGERLADIADECAHLADTELLSAAMYESAVSLLSQMWAHGEALRLWAYPRNR